MLMRKINAVIGLLATIFLLIHAIYIAVWAISMGSIPEQNGLIPWILVGLMAIHAFISIDLAISAHSETEKCKCKNYPKMNASTIVQRISGVLMVIFTGLHVAGATGALQPPKIIHAINPPLFFALALTHAAVSTGKTFITLGIGNVGFVKAADITIKILCAATFVADIIGFFLYLY